MDFHFGSTSEITALERTSWYSRSGLSVVRVNLCQGGVCWILGQHFPREWSVPGVFGQWPEAQDGILGVPRSWTQGSLWFPSAQAIPWAGSQQRSVPSKSQPPWAEENHCCHWKNQRHRSCCRNIKHQLVSQVFTCLDKDVFRMCGFPRSAPAFNHEPSAEIYFYPIKQWKHPTMLCRSILKSEWSCLSWMGSFAGFIWELFCLSVKNSLSVNAKLDGFSVIFHGSDLLK